MQIIKKHWHDQIHKLNKLYIQKKIIQFLSEDNTEEDIQKRIEDEYKKLGYL